ncbi:uncharacterized protein AB675_8846 [Cyphellophora attinorum]|uniref:Procollagen galactosyltransferase 1 n=1 Tax=Cyphellophora attinorum TaxID=1664694 RepID=A0A0N1NWU4_9EURO|nr:uncharacterized protein AB675_8846 [Phialophora attinorum]KPI36212.1 hypothetical protein AB675_8846 [Phialophora attinorum]
MLFDSKPINGVSPNYRAIAIVGVFILTVWIYFVPPWGSSHPNTDGTYVAGGSSSSGTSPRELAANATLGFQTILALSTGPSWRSRGLNAAAKYVGIQVQYPPQPRNPESLVEAFQKIGAGEGKTTPAKGSATAWFAHLDLLKHFIASDLETAFIVEDDVDFDVNIKQQIRLASDNVRNFTKVTDGSPWGKEWDMLWLGHCGTAMVEAGQQEGLRYRDNSRCKTDLYSGWSKHFLRDFLEEDHRIVQWAGFMTVCTFGYGVHRDSAQKILDITAAGADEAFDVALSHACGTGKLKCLVVNPQMFNHYEPSKDSGYLSEVHIGDGQGAGADDAKVEKSMGTTGNIMQSARCKVLFNNRCMRPPSEI